jgi:hypothetical protein
MGQELDCTMHFQRRTIAGRAHLETDFLLFRGPERLKLSFKDLTGVKASGGVLRLEFDGGPASFDLGKAAEKWADKILHPPSRLDKLGVKDGAAVALVGDFEPDFVRELTDRRALVVAGKEKPALVCFAAKKTADLSRVQKLAVALPPKGALWVIYPKGVAVIREIEVIEAGRGAGLKDVKVASFSTTHTGLKFVK